MNHKADLDRRVGKMVEAQIRCAQIRETRAQSPGTISQPSIAQGLRDLIDPPTLACEANGLKA